MKNPVNRAFSNLPQKQSKSIKHINLVVYVVVKICNKFRPPDFKLKSDFLPEFKSDFLII
ncbi:hypothetical protein DXU93_14105 [Brumimicrobium aurantiacum]|uniref:Uncharacterized protein n=1 Tax=Brumimicrobium aurantiacum TaxID=1737063 RepID=A0A3E1EUI9_9FLAO|nr:hypothetical protein DXU93_14105 [Brumimicrobium aurantiacum]